MGKKEYGIIAPLRGEAYTIMKNWLEMFRSYSNLCIYGAGNRGKLLLRWLRAENIEVEAFIDSDIRLHGGVIDGLSVLPKENVLSKKYKIIISPYEYDGIEKFLKVRGYKENKDYFIVRHIEIPIVDSQKIYLNNNLFQQIRENIDIKNISLFPVYIDNRIVDYYKIDKSMLIFDRVLNNLLNEEGDNGIPYLPLYQKNGGVILQEWDELSEIVICYFRKHHIPVFLIVNCLKKVMLI